MNTPKLSQSRIFTYPSGLPASKETSFVANRDVALSKDPLTGKWSEFVWTTKWEPLDDSPLKGKDGLNGVTPIFKIGTVTTLSAGQQAQVSISPDAQGNILLNFGIPAGADGLPGTGSGGANVGSVRWVSNASELNSAWAGIASGTVRSINLAADITMSQPLVIPAGYSRILEIHGHGNKLVVPANMTAISRQYASLQEANAGIDTQLRITDVIFESTNRTAKAINVEATYGTRIQGCRFYNFDTAIKCSWMMGTVIDQCYFWENNISIDLDYARFAGGSNSASQSNHSIIRDCKFRHSTGQFGAVKSTAVSGLVVDHSIFEGIQDGPQYEIYFDDNGSTVVKEVTIKGCHIEQQPSVAGIYVKLNSGIANIDTIFSQYACNLVSFNSGAYGKMILSNVPYLVAGTKFKNVNAAGRWRLINPIAEFSVTDTARWDGAIPTYLAVEGWDPNGQKAYLQNVTVK